MGVLPLQFVNGETRDSLAITGDESFAIIGIPAALSTGAHVQVTGTRPNGNTFTFDAKPRIDTPQEAEYYRNGGILPYVLRQLIANSAATV
jgi:aconitate hydratase